MRFCRVMTLASIPLLRVRKSCNGTTEGAASQQFRPQSGAKQKLRAQDYEVCF